MHRATATKAKGQVQGVRADRRSDAAASRPALGNQANLRRLQAKLAVGRVDDPLEREADAAADQVMRMADPVVARSAPPQLHRKCARCEEDELVQREAMIGAAGSAVAPEAVDAALAAPGRPLDPAVRDFMGARFGADFSGVRIHTDAQAAQSAAAVNARAYTVGSDIVFAAGHYDPVGTAGRRLLAHELAHTIQQAGGGGLVQRDFFTPAPDPPAAAQPDLTVAQIREAIRFNNNLYDAANIRLIQSIMGGTVSGQFTPDDIRAIAASQEEYGLRKDGKVGPDTFDFITREQTAEGLGTDTANCLTAFRVTPFPVQSAVTAGPNGTTQIRGHHVVEARFSDRCDCSKFEYRQFIAGVAAASRGGAGRDLATMFSHIPGGTLPIAMTEDGNTTCPSQNYGHRNQPGQVATSATCGQDRYTDASGTLNQAGGCLYRGEDFPVLTVMGLATGDTVDLLVQFRGEIRRDGRVIQTRSWTDIDTSERTP